MTTLWLSKAMLTLANALKNEKENTEEQEKLVENALDYIRWVIRGATSTGLLPEQVDKNRGHAAWAIPLGWSCALFIDNVILLNEWEFGKT